MGITARGEAMAMGPGARLGDSDAARDEAMVTRRVAMETRREASRWRCGVRTDDDRGATRGQAMMKRLEAMR